MNIKKYEEVRREQNKLNNEIKRDFKIQTALIIILSIMTLIVCFKSMKLSVDYEEIKQEKKALEDITEMQRSMISDLEENCKDLYIEIENLKVGGNE